MALSGQEKKRLEAAAAANPQQLRLRVKGHSIRPIGADRQKTKQPKPRRDAHTSPFQQAIAHAAATVNHRVTEHDGLYITGDGKLAEVQGGAGPIWPGQGYRVGGQKQHPVPQLTDEARRALYALNHPRPSVSKRRYDRQIPVNRRIGDTGHVNSVPFDAIFPHPIEQPDKSALQKMAGAVKNSLGQGRQPLTIETPNDTNVGKLFNDKTWKLNIGFRPQQGAVHKRKWSY